METASHRWPAVGLLLAATLLPAGPAFAQAPEAPAGRRLRDIVADRFPGGRVLIGGTTGWNKRPRGSGVTLDREFSYVTPENDFKQSTIHPEPGRWNWSQADAWPAHCAEHGQVLRLHAPIGPQCSPWARDDERTPQELRQNLVEFMTAVCRRYNGHPQVRWLDVVNETVLPDGAWHGPRKGRNGWENPWLILGTDEGDPLRPPSYIRLAFEIATAEAPDLGLVLNQHGGMQEAMWSRIQSLVLYLRGCGLRVDGLGWQAHVDAGWERQPDNLERLHALIRWAHSHALAFHITENTVGLEGKDKDYEAQAQTYAAILRALLSHRATGLVTWNTWNLGDADSYRPDLDGCLFDRAYRPKPAYRAIQDLLEHPPAAGPD